MAKTKVFFLSVQEKTRVFILLEKARSFRFFGEGTSLRFLFFEDQGLLSFTKISKDLLP